MALRACLDGASSGTRDLQKSIKLIEGCSTGHLISDILTLAASF